MTLTLSRLLVPVALSFNDDVHLAEQLVDAAGDLAAKDATLVLLFVHPLRTPVLDTGFTPPGWYQSMAELQTADRENAAAVLKKLEARVTARGLRAVSSIVEPIEGVGEAIAHTAAREHADAIVLWSHGRRGLQRLFLGSVAERVAHVATVPLIILRAPAAAPAK